MDPNQPLPPPVNPDDPGRGLWFMGLTWTLTSLSIIAVATRFWVRFSVTLRTYIEDWIMLLACLLNLSAEIVLTIAFHYGLGKHDESLTMDQMINTGKWTWISYTPSILSSATARISITILLVRLFAPEKWLKWLVIVTTSLSVAAVIAQIVTVFNQMSDLRALWGGAPPVIQIDPSVAMIEGNVIGALFAFGDLVYVAAPVFVVWKLHMPLQQKLGLVALFSLSLLTCGISITKSVMATSSAGTLYGNTLGLFFAIIEQTMVISLGCAPVLSSVTKLKLPSAILSMTSYARRLVSRKSDTHYILEESTDRRDQDEYRLVETSAVSKV